MRFFDLFAGIGGFRLGLESLGYKCVGFCEADKDTARAYTALHNPQGEHFYKDAKSIDLDSMPSFEILCAGFPCQAFSISGHREHFNDKRGVLFYEIIKITNEKKPKIVFLENVTHLLKIQRGAVFAKILLEFWQIGYVCQWQILDTRESTPQARKRVYIIATRYDGITPAPQILPIATSPSYRTLKQIGHLRGGGQGQRIYSNDCSCTLLANGGGQGAKTGLYIDSKGLRMLTPRECFRLQGFSDKHYECVAGLGLSDTRLYRMVNNAVNPFIIEKIAQRFDKVDL